jgi:hypothetical protein
LVEFIGNNTWTSDEDPNDGIPIDLDSEQQLIPDGVDNDPDMVQDEFIEYTRQNTGKHVYANAGGIRGQIDPIEPGRLDLKRSQTADGGLPK